MFNIQPNLGLNLINHTNIGQNSKTQKPEVPFRQQPQGQQAKATTVVASGSALLNSETISAVYEASEAIKSTDTTIKTAPEEGPTAGETAKAKFLEYMSLSPSELYFTLKLEAKLKSMGMTMEQFEALPPEEQQAIIDEVKNEIAEDARKRVENKVQEARLAHSAQQAQKDLAPDTGNTAEDDEQKVSELEKLALRLAENNKAEKEGRDPSSLTSFTDNEIEKTANEQYKNGEITLEELYRLRGPHEPKKDDKV